MIFSYFPSNYAIWLAWLSHYTISINVSVTFSPDFSVCHRSSDGDLNVSETGAVDNHCDDIVKWQREARRRGRSMGRILERVTTVRVFIGSQACTITRVRTCIERIRFCWWPRITTMESIPEKSPDHTAILAYFGCPWNNLDVKPNGCTNANENSKICFAWLIELYGLRFPVRTKPFDIVYDDPYKYSNYIGRHVIQHCNNRQPINSETVPICFAVHASSFLYLPLLI